MAVSSFDSLSGRVGNMSSSRSSSSVLKRRPNSLVSSTSSSDSSPLINTLNLHTTTPHHISSQTVTVFITSDSSCFVNILAFFENVLKIFWNFLLWTYFLRYFGFFFDNILKMFWKYLGFFGLFLFFFSKSFGNVLKISF